MPDACHDCASPRAPITMKVARRGGSGSLTVKVCADCWKRRCYPAYRVEMPGAPS